MGERPDEAKTRIDQAGDVVARSRPRRPNERVRYKKNFGSWIIRILIWATLAAAVYVAVGFVPPYWRYMKASNVIDNLASKTYSRRGESETWGTVLDDVRLRARKKLEGILGGHVAPQDIKIRVERVEGKGIYIEAKWTDPAVFSLIGKKYILTFKTKARANEG